MSERRIALVTGAGGTGIGCHTCHALAEDGFQVIVTDLDRGEAEKVCKTLPGEGHIFRKLDVTNEEEVEELFQSVEGELGPIAVLVCCAGTMIAPADRAPLLRELTTDGWDRTFSVNLRGLFFCVREMLRHRGVRNVEGGRIILLSSASGQTGGIRGGADYAASKAGVLALGKSCAREAASLGITVNCIAPGPIDTPLFQGIVPAAIQQTMIDMMPIKRLGRPREIADMIAFLVSEKAGFITGSTVDINGGSRMQ